MAIPPHKGLQAQRLRLAALRDNSFFATVRRAAVNGCIDPSRSCARSSAPREKPVDNSRFRSGFQTHSAGTYGTFDTEGGVCQTTRPSLGNRPSRGLATRRGPWRFTCQRPNRAQ